MKRYRLIQTSCLVAVALGFAACSQDELSSPTGGVEGAPVTFTATGIATPKVETRSTIDGTWDDGLTVGVKIDGTVKAYAATNSDARRSPRGDTVPLGKFQRDESGGSVVSLHRR